MTGTPEKSGVGTMRLFRKKPVVIGAIQYDGTNAGEIETATGAGTLYARDGDMFIHTLEGEMRASPGDWIIRGVKGELYPCKPDIFAETYEEEPAR